VTSPDGAVWHDIQQVLARRFPLVEVVLSPATVQGERAPASIVAAIEALQADGRADVIILARGGGSTEDLWCFNDERVARAVFASRVPVVTGVGHETDQTLVDDVADLRAPTPSAAAELCSPSIADIGERLYDYWYRLRWAGASTVRVQRTDLTQLSTSLRRTTPRQIIGAMRASTSASRHALSATMAAGVSERRASVIDSARRAGRRQERSIAELRLHTRVAGARIDALNPRSVLDRGYAVLTAAGSGELIHSIDDVADGVVVDAHLRDGRFRSTVASTSRHVPTGNQRRAQRPST